jgi:hypothetical protein
MDPEKSKLHAESAIAPDQGAAILPERENVCAHFSALLISRSRDTISQCTFPCSFTFLISVGLFVNLFLTLIAL